MQARALHKALVLVSDQYPAWTRHDLLKQLALVMPPGTRHMDAAAAHELLLGLVDEALSGRAGDVVSLEAPEWPPLPASLRRELDGRSVYNRPGITRYATTAQLSMEDKLVAQAQAQSAPRLTRRQAAQRPCGRRCAMASPAPGTHSQGSRRLRAAYEAKVKCWFGRVRACGIGPRLLCGLVVWEGLPGDRRRVAWPARCSA
jgi:hypothetical protein